MARSSGRRPLIAGNWKMNLTHLEAIALVQKIAFGLREGEAEQVEIAVLPPFTAIRSVQTLIEGDKLPMVFGGQDLSTHSSGAYTGEIAGPMLAKLGCTYVVVGHSERRQYHGEDDATVSAKARAAYDSGLVPIICVGESEQVREEQRHVEHVLESLTGCLANVLAEHVEEPNGQLVIAYEPVWAIGTGKTATAADAQEMCQALRRRLGELVSPGAAERTRVLYGGSVKAGNAAELLAEPDVDGALVGGASLVAEDFCGIIRGALPANAKAGGAGGS
ncbi:MAG: triose-phosphate isomerase [Acidobacteriota bacterium]|nr:triose-phosphate isomerase [Acidobacteriota bacterium]